VSDPDAVYIVADSDEIDVGRVRLPLAQYPHIAKALETGEVTFSSVGGGAPLAEVSAVFPMIVGRKPLRVLIARFAGEAAGRPPGTSISLGRLGAALVGMVLRGAKALDPIRERTRRITSQDFHEERRVRAIERYRAFIDSASDGIVVLDADGTVLYMNRAAEEVTGYARDGLARRPLSQIVPEAYRRTLENEIKRAIAAAPIDNF